MIDKDKQKLIHDLEIIQQQIDDIKLEDTPDYKTLKELINERERIKFKLGLWE